MTEKEKAAAGLLYDANYDMELAHEISYCVELCYDYNQLRPYDAEEHKKLLIQILGSIGENAFIMPPFWCDYGYNISIGKDFYSNHNLYLTDGGKITIGDHVFIGPNVCITTSEHALDVEQRNKGLEVAKPITIGNNVWIGAGVTILGGVTIGDNTVIGAGSLVKKSIPSNVIAVGNPCKVLREITDADKNKYPGYEEKKTVIGGAVSFRMVDEFGKN